MAVERDLIWKQDLVFVEQEKLVALAKDWPTPFYLYDQAGIGRTYGAIATAFQWSPNSCIWVTVEKMPCPSVLKLVFSLGCGLICGNLQELNLVASLGLAGWRVVYAPMYPCREGLEQIVRLQGTLAVDNLAVGQFALEAGLMPPHIQLRYNPGGLLRKGSRVVAKPGRSKLGMAKGDLLWMAKEITPNTTVSLGAELGASVGDVQCYPAILQALWDVKDAVEDACHRAVTRFYLGDGDAVELAALGLALETKAKDLQIPEAVDLSLGALLLAPNGLLISKILAVKALQRKILILDATRGAVATIGQGSQPYVSLAGNCATEGREFYGVMGASPDVKDRFVERKLLPKAVAGDYCVLHHMGHQTGGNAYGHHLYRPDGTVTAD